MFKYAIEVENLGKMYKIYDKQGYKIREAFGLNFFKKNYYREFWALRGLNLEIKKGERIGFVGSNGAGKSTLLKTIIGNINPTEGKVTVNGNIQALMELGTGFHPEFTGRENIRASLAYQGLTSREIREKEEEIIDFSELEDFIDQPIRTYSAGMNARLAFSTATAIEPEILIIDEVLGAGDAYFAGKCVDRMKKLTNDNGVTVLFVSHDLNSVQALCDRVVWIDRGCIRADGEPLKVIKQYSAEVRKREETRLKIRDLKLSKKQAAIIDRDQDLYNTFLFRFIDCHNNHPKHTHKIRSIRLLHQNQEIACIESGAPMDNNQEYKNYIIDELGLMDWGTAGKDKDGYYRYYGDFNGKYGHAPFQLAVSKEIDNMENIKLEIASEVNDDEIAVELYDWMEKQYRRCGVLNKGESTIVNTFSIGNKLLKKDTVKTNELSNILSNEEETNLKKDLNIEILPQLEETQDIRFTDECKIIKADVLGFDGVSHKIFTFESQISNMIFEIKFTNPMDKFFATFFVFTSYGNIVISNFQEINLEKPEKKVSLTYDFVLQKFGPGEYYISFAVYDYLDVLNNAIEQKNLAIIDRGITFRIEKPQGFNLNVGIIAPKIPIRINAGKEVVSKCHTLL